MFVYFDEKLFQYRLPDHVKSLRDAIITYFSSDLVLSQNKNVFLVNVKIIKLI